MSSHWLSFFVIPWFAVTAGSAACNTCSTAAAHNEDEDYDEDDQKQDDAHRNQPYVKRTEAILCLTVGAARIVRASEKNVDENSLLGFKPVKFTSMYLFFYF